MVDVQILALFETVDQAADAVERLHGLGVPDAEITVMSGVPYDAEAFGRPPAPDRVTKIGAFGGALGVALALFLTAGIYLLYPLMQGGQPLIPIPPSLVIIVEVAMLGLMTAAFVGFLVVNRLPLFGRPVYHPSITAGAIGLHVAAQEELADRAENALRDSGAHEVQRQEGRYGASRGAWIRFVGFVLSGGVVTVAVALLFWYNILQIEFPTQMAHQDSIASLQGPRLSAPESAIPVQGPVLINGQPATAPLPATESSVQRGGVFYSINCAMCHGTGGTGNGPMGGFFPVRPPDLTGAPQRLSDAQIFAIITQGRGVMPGLYENLDVGDTWDVVNYVRTLRR